MTQRMLLLSMAILLLAALASAQAPEELNPPFCLFQYQHCTPGLTGGGLFYFASGTFYYTPNIYFFTPGIYFFTPGTYYVYPDPLLKADVDGVIQNLLHRRSGSRTDPVGSKLYQVHCPSSGGPTPGDAVGGPTTPALNLDGWQAGLFHFTTGVSATLVPGPTVTNPLYPILGAEFGGGISTEVPGTFIMTGQVTSNGGNIGQFLILTGNGQTWQTLGTSTGGSCTLTPTVGLGPFSTFTFPQTDPVLASDGELVVPPVTDFSLGGPLPLTLHRNYTSLQVENSFVGMLGFNWMTNFDPYILTSSNYVAVFVEGGRVTFHLANGAYQMVFPGALPYQLVRTSGGGYRFFDPRHNLIYSFNSAGALISIQDRNGNTLTVTPGATGPTQVSDGLGRSLNFTYTGTKVSKITDQTGRSILYGRNGNLLANVTDANNNTTRFAYDPNFGITSTTRPRGNVPYTQSYTSFTQVSQQTDSQGNKSSITYATGGTPGLNTLTDALGRTTTFSYPNFLDAASITDAAGQTASGTYDPSHRPLTYTDRVGNTVSIKYDPVSGDPASFTDAQGNTTSFTWQPQTQAGFVFYNLAKIGYPDGSSKSFTYDASGNPLTITDRAGKTTTYTYNAAGQVLTETNPAGGVTTNAYNADGTMATSKDPAGNVTTYVYDSLKRLARIRFADNTSRSFTYDAMDKILTVTDERGNVTKFAYNANDDLQSTTDALAKTATTTYDTDDLPISSTDRLGNKTSVQYDPLGSVTAITNGAGEKATFTYDNLERLQTAADPAGKAFTYGYDAEGRLTSETDPLGNTSSIKVDKNGQPVQFTSPLGETGSVAYDSMGRVTGSTDALGRPSSFSYESRGLPASITGPGDIATLLTWGSLPVLASVTDPNGNVWPIATDNQGRVTSATDPLGHAVKVTYESRNRVSSMATPADSVQLSYDAAGNLTRAQYSDGVAHTYTYDSDNRLTGGTGFVFALDANGWLTGSNGLAITRDAAGRIAAVTYAPGKALTYTYDARGLLASVTDWTGASIAFSFDDAHRLSAMTRSNGVVATYTYDNDSDVASITETSNNAILSSIVLTRDGIRRVTSSARNVPQEAMPVGANSTWSFDAANQIAGATYDVHGRLTDDKAGSTYKWNAASRLVSYTRPDGSASSTYDGLGQRISSTVSGTTQNYVLNYATGLPTVAIVQSGGSDQTYYVYTPDGELLFSVDASSGAHHFYSFDETGSTIFLTGDSGSITDSYGISPDGGVVTAGPNNSTSNPFTWQGQLGVMQAGGLYYARFRYYDSATGRFLSRDPLFSADPREVNPYQYAAGDPLSNGDPEGLKDTKEPFARLWSYVSAPDSNPGWHYNDYMYISSGAFFSNPPGTITQFNPFIDSSPAAQILTKGSLRPSAGEISSFLREPYTIAYDPAFYNILLNTSTNSPLIFGTTPSPSVAISIHPTTNFSSVHLNLKRLVHKRPSFKFNP